MIKHIWNINPTECHMGPFMNQSFHFSMSYVLLWPLKQCIVYRTQKATALIGPHRPDGALCCKRNFHFELHYPLREHWCFKNNHIMVWVTWSNHFNCTHPSPTRSFLPLFLSLPIMLGLDMESLSCFSWKLLVGEGK